MSSQVKSWLLLAIIFLIGAVTGSALTYGWASHFTPPPGAEQMRSHWMLRLTQRLTLTDDQQAKIQPILVDAEKKIQALHRDEVDRGSQIIKTANDQISALLTPDQQVELQKMEAEREKMFSGHIHHGGPEGGIHGGPGGMHHPGGWDGHDHPVPDGATNLPPPSASAPDASH